MLFLQTPPPHCTVITMSSATPLTRIFVAKMQEKSIAENHAVGPLWCYEPGKIPLSHPMILIGSCIFLRNGLVSSKFP